MAEIKNYRSSDHKNKAIAKSPEPAKLGSPMRDKHQSPFTIKENRKSVR